MVEICNEILRALERIEGEFIEIRKLSERVTQPEVSQTWLKGGWALLVAVWILLLRLAVGR